ncbi:MAG: class F sortase, partial [Pseudonocardia sp.]|nr:class F sortase [Pseudonocardia sp.]
VAGWFSGSAAPGEPGPSVIAGHVDSRSGPGVFFSLGELDIGAEIEVRRSDGVVLRFRVAEVYAVGKDEFPTERVYGPVPGSELRLITCGGEFDRSARRYLNNVVVTAVLVAP